jgi:integrating conjugative element protein (TIGR03757 family)
MMFRALLPLIVAAVLAAGPAHAQQPIQKVEVFANSAMVLTNAQGATVYRLDGLQQLQDELSQGLPSDPNKAAQIAQQRMRAMGTGLQERASNAATGIGLATQYGVDRMPAVVINGQAIVYGVTDVAEAVRLFLKSAQGNGRRP